MIALCDQRSFYASCEAVFRPDLRDKPIAVLSNNDGCVVALNDQAKQLGVKKFEAYFKQKTLIRRAGVHVFSSNYALYGEISSRIMATLKARTPAVEVYSIDEGFCDLDGIEVAELKAFGSHLRQLIWRQQRIPMGVSMGPTKTLAKLGQYATKKIPAINGVCLLERPDQWEWLAERVPVSEVWGVGRRLTVRLNSLGVRSALDLMRMPLERARTIAGVTMVRTVKELNGDPCIEMEYAPSDKQQIICSRSFGQKVTSLQELKQAVSGFAVRVSEKLRAQKCNAGRLSVWIQTSNYEHNRFSDSNSITLPGGTDDARRLSECATRIVEELFRSGYRYAKAGVGVLDVRPHCYWQRDLLSDAKAGSAEVMKAMDAVNRKYGSGTLRIARQGYEQRFAMAQNMLSPRYLTRWCDIPTLGC